MIINKLFKLSLFVLVVSMSLSCSNKEKEAEEIAVTFLDSYFKTDYETAAELCTPELADEIITSFKSLEAMEKGVRDMILKQTSMIKTEITDVVPSSGKDSMIVSYKVILPEFPKGMQNRLILVKSDNSWKVSGFGE